MRSHVDWLTFTLTPVWAESKDDLERAIADGILRVLDSELAGAVFDGECRKRERSRAPYTEAWEWVGSGITVFASLTLTHFTVEISGQGCERLISIGVIEDLLARVYDRVTRIDIATDIETETQPTEFVSQLSHERMRASGYQKSETGETCYVGSQKSDRYARVYRYAKPHPRAALLRVECVFRREYAKSVCKSLLGTDVHAIAKAAGDAFGWAHRDWQPLVQSAPDISSVKVERNGGKTVFWLVNSVAPAFRRLCESGIITNPEEFVTRYFLSPE